MAKSVSEVKAWAFLSDNQRRQKAFGDPYAFTQMMAAHTPQNATILLYTTDTLLPLLSRYYLYPRIVTVTGDRAKFIALANTKRFPFVAVYTNSLKIEGYLKIATFVARNSRVSGYLYEIPQSTNSRIGDDGK
jgi:hypothetical protein